MTTQVAQPIFHHMEMSREKMIQSLECDYISEKLKGHYLIKAHLLAMCLGVKQYSLCSGHVVFVYIYIDESIMLLWHMGRRLHGSEWYQSIV